VSTVENSLERTLVDGVPVLWAEAPGQFTGTLMFRVGRADETLPTAGASHLVEHLALSTAGTRRFTVNGFVDGTRTAFWSAGTRDEVTGFLTDVARALGDLPLDRLDAERRVLRTEESSSGANGPPVVLLGLRYGPHGHGLLDYRELGLHQLGPDAVSAWARARFTSGNAAVWLSAPPPDDFSLRLAPGEAFAPPELEPIPGLALPAHVDRWSGGVAIGFLVERTAAATTLLRIAAERVHEQLRMTAGLTYSVGADYLPLTKDVAHVTLGADCLDEHATRVRDGILDVLEALAADGPTEGELADAAADARRWWADPSALTGRLDQAATDVLFGKKPEDVASLVSEVESLEPRDIASLLEGALAAAILVAPPGATPVGRGYVRYDPDAAPRPEGRTYRGVGQRPWDRKPTLVADETGIALVQPHEPDVVVPFASCVAVVRRDDGAVSLLGRDGSSVEFVPTWVRNGDELLALVERHVTSERVVFAESEDVQLAVINLALEKIGRRSFAWRELERLPGQLEPGERVLTLAQVERLFGRGLLAATDRRLLFLGSGFTRRANIVRSYRYESISDIRKRRDVTIVAEGRRVRLGKLTPAACRKEIVALVRERLAAPDQ
jgi:zinc protease